jgi:hypothetical protein
MLKDAALADVASAEDTGLFKEARPMMVQSLLRHAMAEAISDGFINCLVVTSVVDANIQLSRIHGHIFTRKCFVMFFSTIARFAFRLLLHPFSCPLNVYYFPHIPSYHSSKMPRTSRSYNSIFNPFPSRWGCIRR